MSEPIAWMNDAHVPISQARLSVLDLGVMQGVTVSEMLRTFAHIPFRVDDHLRRFQDSLQHVGLTCPRSSNELSRIIDDLCAQNTRSLTKDDDLGIAVFATAGLNTMMCEQAGLGDKPAGPTLCVHTYRLPWQLWAEKARHGQHLIVPARCAVPPSAVHPHIKTRSRLHWYLADRDARQQDKSATALLVDGEGYVTETSTANFLMVQNGTLITPPEDSTLPGISRQVVRELAEQLRIPFEFRRFTPEDVYAADEAFTSSTPYCLLPVTRLNNTLIGTGRPGPIYHRLLQAWSQMAGLDIIGQLTASHSART